MAYARHHADVPEVPDPYYGGAAGFDRVLDLVEDACEGLAAHLASQAPPSAPQVETDRPYLTRMVGYLYT
jgi:hypothetical protein